MPKLLKVSPGIPHAETALRAVSALPAWMLSGKRVFIKPNWVSPKQAPTGVTVDPQFVRALSQAVYTMGAVKVAVGEASINRTEAVFTALGVRKTIGGSASVMNLSDEKEWARVPLPEGALKGALIPEAILGFDTIISVAKLKTHCLTRVSLTVKNLFGLLSPASRKAAHGTDLEMAIAGLYLYLRGRMNVCAVLDGGIALNGWDGPLKGDAVPLGIMLAGGDAWEVDYAGCLSIGCAPSTVGHLSIIQKKEGLKFDRAGFEEPLMKFDLPPIGGWRGPVDLSPVLRVLFRKKPKWGFSEKCTFCGDCERICPKNSARVIDGKVLIDRDSCVECLCCAEVCASGAMTYSTRLGWLHAALKKTADAANGLRSQIAAVIK